MDDRVRRDLLGNDCDLMEFATWLAMQPDAENSGLVTHAGDHATKTCSIWWAGPETDFLRRMRAEARSRGITLVVHPAKYFRAELTATIHLIWAARARFERVGFDLNRIAGPNSKFFGLVVNGTTIGADDEGSLPPDVVAAVREELDVLLKDAPVASQDVKIEYGRIVLL
jgi:hypothetical protein